MSTHVDALHGLIDGESDDLALILQPVVDVLTAVDELSTQEMAEAIVTALLQHDMVVVRSPVARTSVTVKKVLDGFLAKVKGHANHDSGPSEG